MAGRKPSEFSRISESAAQAALTPWSKQIARIAPTESHSCTFPQNSVQRLTDSVQKYRTATGYGGTQPVSNPSSAVEG